ncbi:lipopolysaccharide biosynthesis protein [Burkholderia plantarii]|uniref:lipopolysaccharide biosynthesis protein n=1 Tax=Burkholderia plantarii TaxID=41899 RepID=UPI00209AA7B1|nr:oligosaccharide flippase family protein [Burkholderia plantarii]
MAGTPCRVVDASSAKRREGCAGLRPDILRLRSPTTMLKRSLIANYAGQVVTIVLGMVMVPVYVRHLGVEAYGLIAFNAVLLAWVQLLDLGLSPTLCRELARARDEAATREVRVLLQSLEKFVSGICLVLILLSGLAAPLFATGWLNASSLPPREVELAFVLMVLTMSARWLSSLYRGGMVGIDRQATLNTVIVIFAVLRAVLVVPLIAAWPRVEVFFVWQLGAILGEAATMRVLLGRAVGAPAWSRTFSREVLLARARLSLSIAFSALMWATSTQADKIILSKLLPLSAFGEFSMATLLAGGILLLASPIQQAFTPRFTADSVRNAGSLKSSYFLASEIMMIAVMPVAILFASVPGLVFRLWSASLPMTPELLRILQCYALGNACSAVAGLCFLIQYAAGDLSLHIKGNLGFVAILVPAVLLGALHYGARGAAYAWLAINLAQLFLWVGVVHRRFLPGINARWYRGLASRGLVVLALGAAFRYAAPLPADRFVLLLMLGCMWLLMVAAMVAVSPISQRKAMALARRLAVN